MDTCSACKGFLPSGCARCPNCDSLVKSARSSLGKATRAVGAILSGTAVSMTLMACYGAPSMEELQMRHPDIPVECDPETDPECEESILRKAAERPQ